MPRAQFSGNPEVFEHGVWGVRMICLGRVLKLWMRMSIPNEAAPTGPNVEILISNLSSPFVAALGSVAMHDRLVQKTGADGMEVTLLNPRISRFTRQVLREADMTAYETVNPTPSYGLLGFGLDAERSRQTGNDIKSVIHSLHASFKSEAGPSSVLSFFLPTGSLMPTREESLGYMRRTQMVTGQLPAVLYTAYADTGPGQVKYSDERAPFATRTFQPKKSDWTAMGLTEESNVADIKAAMAKRGLTGITLDLFHILEFDDPETLAGKLAGAGLVDAVHVSVGRTDITGFWSKAAAATRKASRAFARSAEAANEVPEGKILGIILSKWADLPEKQRRVVIEKGPFDMFRRTRKLARIVLNTRTLVNNAMGALPN